MVRYPTEIRKVLEPDTNISGSCGKVIKDQAARKLVERRGACGPSPYFVRIPFAPLLSTRIFSQEAVPINQANAVSARRPNCMPRTCEDTHLRSFGDIVERGVIWFHAQRSYETAIRVSP
jgi:hypothetical protein